MFALFLNLFSFIGIGALAATRSDQQNSGVLAGQNASASQTPTRQREQTQPEEPAEEVAAAPPAPTAPVREPVQEPPRETNQPEQPEQPEQPRAREPEQSQTPEQPVATPAPVQPAPVQPAPVAPPPQPVVGEVEVSEPAPQPPQQNQSETPQTVSLKTEIDISKANSTVVVDAGRTATLELDANNIAEVEITSELDYGRVTVNPDNTLSLVLTGTNNIQSQSFDLQITQTNGNVIDKTVHLDVNPIALQGGWGLGDFYTLAEDEDGASIVETGDNHRKVHVSGDDNALTLADIANMEGIDIEAIDATFWDTHPQYGATPDMALAEDAGAELWARMTHSDTGPNSNWLLFEKGYVYEEVELLRHGTTGESELHPIYIGAYGEGARPVIESQVRNVQDGTDHVVIRGLELSNGVYVNNFENLLFEDVVVTDDVLSFRANDGMTVKDSSIWEVARDAPVDGSDYWDFGPNRISGSYGSHTESLLIENTFFDHNGWEAGYDFNLTTAGGQPPSLMSHNIYLQSNNGDITFRDNILMQGAGGGAQVRSGGFLEDNVYIDNNGAGMFGSGKNDSGNYSLVNGNVITSGAHKLTAEGTAARTFGLGTQGKDYTMIDNIVTHVADPNNPDEIAAKVTVQAALHTGKSTGIEAHYDDTIVYNWFHHGKQDGTEDRNIDGLNTQVLDQTTIQLFTAQLLGKDNATIQDLSAYLRAEANGALDDVVDADVINNFFKAGFGLDTTLRSDAETVRFIPSSLGDGVRWDNRLNWSTDDLPGTQDGDRVELGGNWLKYAGAGTNKITDLDFGDGGALDMNGGGKLTVEDHISVGESGAELKLNGASQFWANGYTDQDLLEITAEGGRFANTGLWTGKTDLEVSDNAQVLLAAGTGDYVMGAGSHLTIKGGDARVGFDGDGDDTGVLLMSDKSTLEFVAEDGRLGMISEFRSGAFDDDGGDIQSGINLGDSTLRIDITGLKNGAGTHKLMAADELIGMFGDIKIEGLAESDRNAVLTIDYHEDIVALQLGAAGVGTGAIATEILGNEGSARGNTSLFSALTNGHGIYEDDLPVDIPTEEDDDPFVL